MSSLLHHATRRDLRIMRSASLSYGRRLLSAEAIEELIRRAVDRRVWDGCKPARVARMKGLVIGRMREVNDFIETATLLDDPVAYSQILNSLLHTHAKLEASHAAAAFNEVLRGSFSE